MGNTECICQAEAESEVGLPGVQVQFLDREHLLLSVGSSDAALLRSSDVSSQVGHALVVPPQNLCVFSSGTWLMPAAGTSSFKASPLAMPKAVKGRTDYDAHSKRTCTHGSCPPL